MRQRVLQTLRAELTWRHLGQAAALVAVALLGPGPACSSVPNAPTRWARSSSPRR